MKNAATFFCPAVHCQTLYGIFSSHKPIIIVNTYSNLIIYAQYYFISAQFISNYRYSEKMLLEISDLGTQIRYASLETT